mmetsp:Transcript_26143/g.84371  ORF Transcript_26143/g.84371 Transcript_26143/m.84371 type:complete len:204 (-) Transcript_26143:938-1549(-)
MGMASPASAAGPPDAVHVVFNGEGEGEVDHDLDHGDIEPSGCYICGNQQRDGALLEAVEGRRPCGLSHVALDSHAVVALALQHLLDSRGLLLVQRKDEHPVGGGRLELFEELEQPPLLLWVLQHLNLLGDPVVGGENVAADVDTYSIPQKLGRESADALWPRRREHDGAACGRRGGDDGANVFLEAHVQHAVSLIEHQVLHAG